MAQVIVPQEDLDRLETARLVLFELAEAKGMELHQILEISQPMWKLTHRRYPEYKEKEGGVWCRNTKACR